MKEVEQVAVESLRFHPSNPRQGDVGAICQSIEKNGWYGTIVAQRSTGHVLAGNHRLKAAIALGIETVPVYWVDVDDATAKRILIADNRTNDLASYNESVLAELLADVANTSGLEGTGYDGDDLDDLIDKLAGPLAMSEEDAPEAQISIADELQRKWKTERGQLWQIGQHRLMCGDSTSKSDVARLMGDAKVDAMVTDPPYGLGDTQSVKNNYSEYEDTRDNLKQIIAKVFPLYAKYSERQVITPGNRNQYLYPAPDWTMAWFTPAGVGRGPWGFCCWQPILCYGKDPRLATGKGSYPDALVHTESAEKNGHPCPKPVKFWAWLIERATVEHGAVVDPFMGSGTTIVVAEQLKRKSFGMELDPSYVAVTLQRMVDMGLTPELIDGTTTQANA